MAVETVGEGRWVKGEGELRERISAHRVEGGERAEVDGEERGGGRESDRVW